jgi:hypothetical protein
MKLGGATDALAATVKWFTDCAKIRLFVMAVTVLVAVMQ